MHQESAARCRGGSLGEADYSIAGCQWQVYTAISVVVMLIKRYRNAAGRSVLDGLHAVECVERPLMSLIE